MTRHAAEDDGVLVVHLTGHRLPSPDSARGDPLPQFPRRLEHRLPHVEGLEDLAGRETIDGGAADFLDDKAEQEGIEIAVDRRIARGPEQRLGEQDVDRAGRLRAF